MGFFSDMGLFEKVAFVVCLPVIVPVAAAVAGYETVTEGKPFWDSESPSSSDEHDAVRKRIESEAKAKQAAEERIAICAYAQKGLLALQTVNAPSVQPIATVLYFYELKAAVRCNQQPIEIVGPWLPGRTEGDAASAALREIKCLVGEISELQHLREAVLHSLAMHEGNV